MEKNPTSQKATAGSPPLLGSFFQGFRTGAFNSSLMMGIFTGVAAIFSLSPIGWGAAGAAILATSIFTGVLGVKKTMDSAKSASHAVPAASVTMQPRSKSRAITREIELDETPTTLRSDWAERTGRKGNTQARVGEIIANGPLADQDHAEALRARDAEMVNSNYRS